MNFGTLLILLYNSSRMTDVRTLLQHEIQVTIRPQSLNYKPEVSNISTDDIFLLCEFWYIIMVITSSWNIYIITEWSEQWVSFYQFFISYKIACFFYKQHFLCTAWKMSGHYSSLFDASHFVLNVIFTVCPTNRKSVLWAVLKWLTKFTEFRYLIPPYFSSLAQS